ncbi:MAG: right-handed parallel beta-helix repeat-containing protein [Acidobacteriota bacterium]
MSAPNHHPATRDLPRSDRPRRRSSVGFALGLVAVLGGLLAVGSAHGFPYRGEIRLSGAAVDGQLDVLFTLFDAAEGGHAVGEPFLAEQVAVLDDDSFTVEVDFGRVDVPDAGPDGLWLEVHVLKAGAFGPFEALKPRRRVTRSSDGTLRLALQAPQQPGLPALDGRRAAPIDNAPIQRPPGLVPPSATRPLGLPPLGQRGTLNRDLTPNRDRNLKPLPSGLDLATGRPVGASESRNTLIRDLTLPTKASATPLYSEFGWQGSSGADLSNFSASGNVLRITEEANSNLFEVDFGHLVPGVIIDSIPVTLNEPGHYYLIGNLSNTVTNADGIVIDADNVTIDMNGYTLYGEIFTAIDGDDGIVILGSQTNIKIYNGAVIGWGGDGINALNADFSIFKDLHVSLNEGDGLVTDFNCLMERVTSFSNGLDGIEGDDGSIIFDCTAGGNDDNGIQTSEGGLVVDSASYDNRIDGFDVGAGSVVKNCSASSNGTFGFDIALGGMAIESTAYDNMSNGFDMASACILRSCLSSANQGHGVRTFANSWVIDNSFHGNVFDGMRISSTDCHVEGNHTTDNGRTGLAATSSGGFHVRNVARGNQTNYTIEANNAFGPIVDVGGIGDLTNDAAAAHPWANFEF